MADLSNVVTVSLIEEGTSVARDNMNVTCIMSSTEGILSSSNRYQLYSNSASVEADFGSTSDEAKFAQVYFAQSPNPVNAGGVLVIGFWRAADENLAASAADLTGEQVTEAAVIPVLQQISDGSFDVDIDGVTENITGLDLRVVTTFEEIVILLNAELSGGVASLSDGSFVITSSTTGITSLISYTSSGASGTFVGGTLGLDANSSSKLTQGADASVLPAETKVEGITAVKAAVNIKGACFIDDTTDQEAKDLATWGQANSTMQYDVFSNATNLNVDVANPVWAIKLAGQVNYRMQYSKAGNRTLAVGYMSQNHTVIFTGENTAKTMHLKEIKSVVAEAYSQSEITAAKTVGLDIYTTFKETVPKLLTSGANGFTDNVYNLMAYVDSVQTDAFNLLGGTTTKIPQTTPGLNALLDGLEKTSQGYVTAGVFAPGTWTLSDRFGDIDTFNRNIEEKGYYWYSIPLSDQVQSERAERKTPVLQNAVKNAGAFHSASIIITFNL
jgi:hypothetical protein